MQIGGADGAMKLASPVVSTTMNADNVCHILASDTSLRGDVRNATFHSQRSVPLRKLPSRITRYFATIYQYAAINQSPGTLRTFGAGG